MENDNISKIWFVFKHSNLLLIKSKDGSYSLPVIDELTLPINLKPHIMTVTPMSDGTEVRTLLWKDSTNFDITQQFIKEKDDFEWCNLRSSFYKLPLDLYQKAGKCFELLYWDDHTRFCGTCGAPMKMVTDISKKCSSCGNEIWPKLATAIIVLIYKDDEVLLVHAHNFKSDFYGLVAGFVETGETLEEAVHREVMEETGLTIQNLRYFGSQPWPYPCGLMVGFYAEYKKGDIRLQKDELSKGDWFHHDNLPTIPEKLSIARKLIDNWLESFND